MDSEKNIYIYRERAERQKTNIVKFGNLGEGYSGILCPILENFS